MTTMPSLVFSRLHLPLPLPADQALLFFERLATDQLSGGLILETRAGSDGIVHLLGCAPTEIHHVRLLLGELIPGSLLTGLDGYQRLPAKVAGRLSVKPTVLPLSNADPARVVKAIYTSLTRRFGANESAILQVAIGHGAGPHMTARTVPEPGSSWILQALTGRQRDASTETRNRIRDRAASFSLNCTIRIGATADDAARRERFTLGILNSFALAQSPGVHIGLIRESPAKINSPATRRILSLRLSAIDLLTLTGWPIGDTPLPGMPPLHPKLIRAASAVNTKDRVFAQSTVPGDSRQLGISSADAMYHGFVIGPTGSGKTYALYHLIEASIRAGDCVVVLDPKDQMPEFIEARIPEERWGDVVHIDPSQANPIGFNPLDVSGRDPDVVADGILAVFAAIFTGWGPRTEDIFSASLRTLARASTAKRPNTLIDLPRLWTDTSFRRSQLAKVADDPGLMGFWSEFEALSPAAQANWLASPMNKLRSILLRPAAVKILSQTDSRFRLRDVFREHKIVLISLNEGLIGPLTAQLLGSLAIAELWQATQERVAEKDAAKHPAHLFVDEADRFMHLPISLGDALARSRSMSVGWFLAAQYWDQLPGEMRSAIKTNARNKVAFKLESDDDARTFARLAPGLTELDFMQLGKYEIYTNLVADGITTGWASARTLPPSLPTSDPQEVRRLSNELYGLIGEPESPSTESHDAASPTPATSKPTGIVARKKRQS